MWGQYPFDADDLVQRYKAGESMLTLAKLFRTDRTTIHEILDEHGVKPRGQSEATRLANLLKVDAAAVVRRYAAGTSIHALSAEFGVDRYVIRRVLREGGTAPRTTAEARRLTRKSVDEQAIIDRYTAGESANGLATAFGMTAHVVYRVLGDNGVAHRGALEANNLVHDQITTEQRRQRATKHAVTWEGRAYPRLTIASPEGMRRRALALQSSWAHQKPDEIEVLGLLPRGWADGQQVAVDRYNIDFTRGSVAVEIHSAGLHPFRTEQTVCRAIELADHGWHVIYFWLNKSTGNRRVSVEGIEKLVACAEFLDRDPSERRQYLVIRGRGELVTAGRFDTEQRTLIAAAVDAPEAADGNHARIAG